MKDETIIEEVQRIRREIAESCDFDPDKLFALVKKHQEENTGVEFVDLRNQKEAG